MVSDLVEFWQLTEIICETIEIKKYPAKDNTVADK